MPREIISGAESNLIHVAGRVFLPCADTTFEQDMFIMKILRDAGLSQLTESFDPTKDTLSDMAQDLIVRAFASGKLFLLLAATIEEQGVPWSMTTAATNGTFFSQLRKKEDKEALRGSIVGILTGFLISGVMSSMTSLKSSPDVALNPAQPNDDAPPSSSEAPDDAILESGTPSSEPLLDTTLTASP